MAEKRTINLDVNTNAKEVGNEFDNLNKTLDQTTKTNKDLHASFEEVYGEIKPLTAQMGEMEDRLYQMAKAGEQNTQEFQNLLKEVGKYRKTQIETDLAVDTAAQTMSQKMGTALQGAASGFALVQGAMGLFGTESEEVEAALLKVNSAMALADGVRGVQEFTKSFGLASKATKAFTLVQKGLNLVLAANPFALMVTAVVALIGYFAVFTDAVQVVIDGLMAVSDWLGITDSEAEANASKREAEAAAAAQQEELARKRAERLHKSKMVALDNEIALARAQGKDTTELQKKKLQNEIVLREAALATLLVEEAKIEVYRAQLLAMSKQSGLAGELGRAGLEGLEEHKIKLEETKAEIEKLKTDIKIVDIEARKSRSSGTKTDPKAIAKEQLDIARKLEDEKIKLMEDGKLKEAEILRVKYERLIADTLANEKLKEEQKDELINTYRQQRIQAEQELWDVSFPEKLDKEIKLVEKKLSIEEQFYQESARLAQEHNKAVDEARAKEIEDDANKWQLRMQLANDSLGAINNLVQTFAGEGEEAQKRAFKVNKAVSIAQAVISTAQGITAQLAVPQDALTGANFVKAGIVAATGIAQVAKISATKFEGGDTGVDEPPDGNETATPTAQFNVVGDSGINQLAELQQQPTKAFVVSGDVTTAQSLDRNRVQNATL